MLLGFVFILMGISFVQRLRSERSLEALSDFSKLCALALGDGKPVHIGARELVVGDVVLLDEGDRVPADVHLVQVSIFAVDESLLKGGPAPVSETCVAGARDCTQDMAMSQDRHGCEQGSCGGISSQRGNRPVALRRARVQI